VVWRFRTRPTKKIGKSERTRAAILNAAFDFIWSRPFRDMAVSSLMATTGMSRSAFYQYFSDVHELMETLLDLLQDEILVACDPWLSGVGDPVELMQETMTGLIQVCYRRGPFLRAISDAATNDERFEKAWKQFLDRFDDAACARIEADQKQGLIPGFEARPVAFALNRLDAYALIEAFGQRPRSRPEPVREALARVWVSTLYGAKWLSSGSSTLVRT
jgi:AcrR family transcriptional regulator